MASDILELGYSGRFKVDVMEDETSFGTELEGLDDSQSESGRCLWKSLICVDL